MENAKLTVLMPAKNVEKYIELAIFSTLNQTYKNFELWVLENGSTDKTAQIVKNIKDPRLKIFELGSVGIKGAIEYGIKHSKSDWLARMDADDIIPQNRFEIQMRFLDKNPNIAFVGTSYSFLTPFGHVFKRNTDMKTRLVTKNNLAAFKRYYADPSVVFNRNKAAEVGGTDKDFDKADLPLWFRLLSAGEGWEISDNLYIYRLRYDSVLSNPKHGLQSWKIRKKYAPGINIDDKHHPELPPQNSYWSNIFKLESCIKNNKCVKVALEKMILSGDIENAEFYKNRMRIPFWSYYFYFQMKKKYNRIKHYENYVNFISNE